MYNILFTSQLPENNPATNGTKSALAAAMPFRNGREGITVTREKLV